MMLRTCSELTNVLGQEDGSSNVLMQKKGPLNAIKDGNIQD